MVDRKRSSTRDVTPTQLGMLLGMVAGAVIGVTMFAITTNALWFILPGVGVACGLGVGATIENRRPRGAIRGFSTGPTRRSRHR